MSCSVWSNKRQWMNVKKAPINEVLDAKVFPLFSCLSLTLLFNGFSLFVSLNFIPRSTPCTLFQALEMFLAFVAVLQFSRCLYMVLLLLGIDFMCFSTVNVQFQYCFSLVLRFHFILQNIEFFLRNAREINFCLTGNENCVMFVIRTSTILWFLICEFLMRALSCWATSNLFHINLYVFVYAQFDVLLFQEMRVFNRKRQAVLQKLCKYLCGRWIYNRKWTVRHGTWVYNIDWCWIVPEMEYLYWKCSKGTL